MTVSAVRSPTEGMKCQICGYREKETLGLYTWRGSRCSTGALTRFHVFIEITGPAVAMNVWLRSLDRFGVSERSRARALSQCGARGIATAAGSLCCNKRSKNNENENRDEHFVPAPKSCRSLGRGRSQTTLHRAVLGSAHSQFHFVGPGFQESSILPRVAVLPLWLIYSIRCIVLRYGCKC